MKPSDLNHAAPSSFSSVVDRFPDDDSAVARVHQLERLLGKPLSPLSEGFDLCIDKLWDRVFDLEVEVQGRGMELPAAKSATRPTARLATPVPAIKPATLPRPPARPPVFVGDTGVSRLISAIERNSQTKTSK
jgi:hypothetical protein